MTQSKHFTSHTADELPIHKGEGADELIAQSLDASTALATAPRTFVGYAPPNFWGPAVQVAAHIGVVTYTIDYEAIGDTLVRARVTYWKGAGAGRKVTEEFRGSTTITTANAVANVECEFMGIPLGSTVNGTCNP